MPLGRTIHFVLKFTNASVDLRACHERGPSARPDNAVGNEAIVTLKLPNCRLGGCIETTGRQSPNLRLNEFNRITNGAPAQRWPVFRIHCRDDGWERGGPGDNGSDPHAEI